MPDSAGEIATSERERRRGKEAERHRTKNDKPARLPQEAKRSWAGTITPANEEAKVRSCVCLASADPKLSPASVSINLPSFLYSFAFLVFVLS